MNDPNFIISALTIAASAGAAWGSVKVSLNGARRKIDETHTSLHAHMRDEIHDFVAHSEKLARMEAVQIDRLARLETKIDLLIAGRLSPVPGGQRAYDPEQDQ